MNKKHFFYSLLFVILNLAISFPNYSAYAAMGDVIKKIDLGSKIPNCKQLSDIGFDGKYLYTEYEDTIYKFDMSGNLVKTILWGRGGITDWAYDGKNFWVTSGYNVIPTFKGTIYKISVSTWTVQKFIDWPHYHPYGIAWDGTKLWVVGNDYQGLYTVDNYGVITRQFNPPGPKPCGLAVDGNMLWIADYTNDSGGYSYRDDKIYKIDMKTGSLIGQFNPPTGQSRGIEYNYKDDTLLYTGEDKFVYVLDSGNVKGTTKGNITIDISDENGNKLNGYLLIKNPPPNVLPKYLQEKFYPYFSDCTTKYLLKSYYVSNGRISFHINDIGGNYNKTLFLFFYESVNRYSGIPLSDIISKISGNAVTWWTLQYRSSDTNSIIQDVRLFKEMDDWTKSLSCTNGQCYFPNHAEKQNYVLEAPVVNGKIYSGNQNPMLLIHGINGQSGYWKDNISALRSKKYNETTENAWVFNYRGTDNIVKCAFLLNKAIDQIYDRYKRKVNIYTHSYGGVVARKYCLDYNESATKKIYKLAMLAPPHHGSYSAERTYRWDPLVLNQRIWLFQEYSLDPMSPIYGELTPGSTNLMSMVGKIFPKEIVACVFARTDPIVKQSAVHDEAPDHDDGPVSISSASLLQVGVPLG